MRTLKDWADYSSDRRMVYLGLQIEAMTHLVDLEKNDESDNSSRHKEEWIKYFFNISDQDVVSFRDAKCTKDDGGSK